MALPKMTMAMVPRSVEGFNAVEDQLCVGAAVGRLSELLGKAAIEDIGLSVAVGGCHAGKGQKTRGQVALRGVAQGFAEASRKHSGCRILRRFTAVALARARIWNDLIRSWANDDPFSAIYVFSVPAQVGAQVGAPSRCPQVGAAPK